MEELQENKIRELEENGIVLLSEGCGSQIPKNKNTSTVKKILGIILVTLLFVGFVVGMTFVVSQKFVWWIALFIILGCIVAALILSALILLAIFLLSDS